MLRAVLNISKTAHATNKSLYEGIPRVSQKIAARRMKLAGHCQRHQELPAGRLVLWEPMHGHQSRGRPTPTYVNVLRDDAGALHISSSFFLWTLRQILLANGQDAALDEVSL